MNYRIAVLVAILMASFAGVAQAATVLETTVAQYNTSAATLPALHNLFWAQHNLALAKDVELMDAWTNYIQAEDLTTADAEWNNYEDAQQDLDNMASGVDAAFNAYRHALKSTCELLNTVLALDVLSPSEVAYIDGSPLYGLTDEPFIFWRDPDFPNRDGLLDFTFEHLSVGLSTNHSSYLPSQIGELMQAVDDLDAWLNFYEWLNAHRNDAADCNAARAADHDALCKYCKITYQHSFWETYLLSRGYTLEQIDDWCDEEGMLERCSETNTSRKAASVRDKYKDKMMEDLDVVREALRDWIERQYGPMYLIYTIPGS